MTLGGNNYENPPPAQLFCRTSTTINPMARSPLLRSPQSTSPARNPISRPILRSLHRRLRRLQWRERIIRIIRPSSCASTGGSTGGTNPIKVFHLVSELQWDIFVEAADRWTQAAAWWALDELADWDETSSDSSAYTGVESVVTSAHANDAGDVVQDVHVESCSCIERGFCVRCVGGRVTS